MPNALNLTGIALTVEQGKWKRLARSVAQNSLAPKAAEVDRDAVYPREGLKAIADAGLMASAPSNAFTILSNADFPYPTVTLSDGKAVKIDQAAYNDLRALSNRADREKVMAAFFTAIGSFRRTYGTTMNGEVQKVAFFARARHYATALEAALDGANIPVSVYTRLVDGVNRNLPAFHWYLRLRKRILGLSDLRLLTNHPREMPGLEAFGLRVSEYVPLDETTDIGTIINNKQFTKVCRYVDEGLKRSDARLVFGGLPPKSGPLSEGYFALPTVFADRSNDWRLAREEIFGPVLVAIRWSDEAEAIRMANDSHYGLAAYVWTHDIGRGLRAAHAIESGWVQVNQGGGQTPGMSYGGYKQSGIGREFSLEGMLDSFTQRKSVTVNLAV